MHFILTRCFHRLLLANYNYYQCLSLLWSYYTVPGMQGQALAFREKVKERLLNSDYHREFLRCLHNYSNEIITKSQLENQVSLFFPSILRLVFLSLSKFKVVGSLSWYDAYNGCLFSGFIVNKLQKAWKSFSNWLFSVKVIYGFLKYKC